MVSLPVLQLPARQAQGRCARCHHFTRYNRFGLSCCGRCRRYGHGRYLQGAAAALGATLARHQGPAQPQDSNSISRAMHVYHS
jgi:hypothetical protein